MGSRKETQRDRKNFFFSFESSRVHKFDSLLFTRFSWPPFDTVSAELDPNRSARLRSQGSGSVLKKKKPSVGFASEKWNKVSAFRRSTKRRRNGEHNQNVQKLMAPDNLQKHMIPGEVCRTFPGAFQERAIGLMSPTT